MSYSNLHPHLFVELFTHLNVFKCLVILVNVQKIKKVYGSLISRVSDLKPEASLLTKDRHVY